MLIAFLLQYNHFYDNRIYEFSRKITNGNFSSSIKFGWWKMFAKSLETSQFWIIKVASFKISNPAGMDLNQLINIHIMNEF